MTLGTGVFLAAIVISLTALFIATKDRWKWKKIILWPLGLLAVASALIGGGVAVNYYLDNRAQPHDTMWGLTLDKTSKDDVIFKKGVPSSKTSEDVWTYAKTGGYDRDSWEVGFKDGKVVFITYTGQSYVAQNLSDIGYGDTTEAITAKFGEPDRTLTSEDNLQRVYCYDKFNVFFELSQNLVKSYGLFSKNAGNLNYCNLH